MSRPAWNDYFMALTIVIAQRSIDPATKCGCVITDKENTILSVGYNSPPRGCNDSQIPLTRPEKYPFMVHAEVNAIVNSSRNGISLKDSTLYCNVRPCEKCTPLIINAGVSRIVYGPFGAKCVDDDSVRISKILLDGQKIEVIQYQGDKFLSVLHDSISYSERKLSN
jgi:dCMP deaminase